MRTHRTAILLAAAFLAAATAANLIIAEHGPAAAPAVAFCLIGLTLVLRDALHDLLEPRELLAVIAALVLAGAGLAYLITPDAGRIAEASALAFAAGLTVDTLVYHAARRLPWLVRSNLSNLAGAAVDSAVFFAVAFATLDGAFGQWTAKVAGGLIFALAIAELGHRRPGHRRPRAR